ncbi:alpha/beta fold hydrolase [Sphingomonas oleivorans]|uniref:alpha/beta fold hydrolase n=1 Tax=Sphingomonas oleivorans TaxID=1735121 RepID=UPI001056E512|nr:alpha/beta hydrolase [Sphingomonas oleivorans]
MLAAFLDKLGIASVDLVANDSGGAVAQIFVTRYPHRVRTLLLTNCDVEPDSPPPALQPVLALAREGTYPDQWLVPWFNDHVLARSPQGFGGMCFSDPNQPTDAAIEMYFGPLIATPARKALTNAYTLGLDPNPWPGSRRPCAGARSLSASPGAWQTTSSPRTAPTISTTSCPTPGACAVCPRPSSSGPRNIRR